MDTNRQIAQPSTSWAAAWAGAALFVLWGLILISFEIPHAWAFPTWARTVLFAALISLLPVGVCIGWIQNFPGWSYPYVGNALLFSLYLSGSSTPGMVAFGIPLFGREMWGWRAWVPLAIVTILALFLTRSLRPITRFFTNIWKDWTLFTFGMFGIMPILVFIGFDEIDRLYSLYFMIILSILMIGVALSYLRANRQKRKVAALLIGTVLIIETSILAPNFYWSGWDLSWQPLIVGIIIVTFMFLPALIGLVKNIFTRPANI